MSYSIIVFDFNKQSEGCPLYICPFCGGEPSDCYDQDTGYVKSYIDGKASHPTSTNPDCREFIIDNCIGNHYPIQDYESARLISRDDALKKQPEIAEYYDGNDFIEFNTAYILAIVDVDKYVKDNDTYLGEITTEITIEYENYLIPVESWFLNKPIIPYKCNSLIERDGYCIVKCLTHDKKKVFWQILTGD